jgi:hypothetical protein
MGVLQSSQDSTRGTTYRQWIHALLLGFTKAMTLAAIYNIRYVPFCPARKWYVLSLRSAMLLVLICGLLSGWTGWRVNRANDQRRAVAAILRAGGGVGYDHKGRPWAPAWLRKRLGDEFFQECLDPRRQPLLSGAI